VYSFPKNKTSPEGTSEKYQGNEDGIYPEGEISGGSASPPSRLGTILGGQINPDGGFRISMGPTLSLPSPTLNLGDI
jgi:hypothetical protein